MPGVADNDPSFHAETAGKVKLMSALKPGVMGGGGEGLDVADY